MAAEGKKIVLYVGTFTRPAPYLKETHGQGIYVYDFNADTGELTRISEMQNIDSPSYLTVDHRGRYLYATSEVWLWPEGTLTAFSIDPASGALTYINKQPTLGSINAYASVDRSNRYAMVANYWDGRSAVMFPIRPDGGLDPVCDSLQHVGKGADPGRQDKSHAHCILTDPTNRFVYVADLGIDKIMIYRLDLEKGRLIPNSIPSADLKPGSGPRHLVFHPNGRFMYAIEELSSSITALAVNGETGALTPLQSVPALPEGFDAHASHCSDLQIHPSGKFIYAGNRGHDSLAIYAVDPDTGMMRYVGHQPTGGNTPRNFAIDPTGAFMLVGNQDSDTIVIFRIDQATGTLTPTGHVAEAPTPSCLKLITL